MKSNCIFILLCTVNAMHSQVNVIALPSMGGNIYFSGLYLHTVCTPAQVNLFSVASPTSNNR